MKAKINLKNIYYYIQGNLRYRLFYSNFAFLIRPHIKEQIEYRINSMDQDCYRSGQCKMCGCATTKLQMSNKSCDKPCYPKMLSMKEWRTAKILKIYKDEDHRKIWQLYTRKKIFM